MSWTPQPQNEPKERSWFLNFVPHRIQIVKNRKIFMYQDFNTYK